MSFYPNSGDPVSNIRNFLKQRTGLPLLIMISVIVWILIRMLGSILFLFRFNISGDILNWLALPANPEDLMMKPWTLITHMFTHFDFFHILFNMLWLYWFGRIFLEFLDRRKLMIAYLGGGLSGGFFFVASYNLFPAFSDSLVSSTAIGASAAVMSVVTTISFYQPNYSIGLLFIGMLRIKVVAIISILMDLLMINTTNSGGHLAHIGGALFGLAMSFALRNKLRITSFRRRGKNQKTNSERDRYTGTYSRPVTDEDYNSRKAEHQKKTDRILDKISRSGYESLTREEKEFLFRSSNNK